MVGNMADTVLEKELRVLHFDPQAKVNATDQLEHTRPHNQSPVTHFLQQGHTPNSATLCEPSIQTQESIGPFLFKPPQHVGTEHIIMWQNTWARPAAFLVIPGNAFPSHSVLQFWYEYVF